MLSVVNVPRNLSCIGYKARRSPVPPPLRPEHAPHFGMCLHELLDPAPDAIALLGTRHRLTVVGVPGGCGPCRCSCGFGREQLGVEVGAAFFQPGFRHVRVGKLPCHPRRSLIDAGVGDPAASLCLFGLPQDLLPRLPKELVSELHMDRDLALGKGPLDRLEHHRVRFGRWHEEHRVTCLQHAHADAEEPRGVSGEVPSRGHEVIHRLRWFEVGGPARIGVLAVGSRTRVRHRCRLSSRAFRVVSAAGGSEGDGGNEDDDAR